MITYTTGTATTRAERQAQAQREQNTPKTAATLSSGAVVQLWTYGINPRTSKLGVVIVIFGCMCVLLRPILYMDSSKPPTAIVVSALQHDPPSPTHPVDEKTGAPLNVSYARVASDLPDPSDPHRPHHHRRNSSFSFLHPSSPTSTRNSSVASPSPPRRRRQGIRPP
jgi:hypothetical protein